MKYLILLTSLLMTSTVCADTWTNEQKTVEAAYIVVSYVDYRQTLLIADAGEETNPVLGSSPSSVEVRNFFLTTASLHLIIAHILPTKWRTKFLYTTAGYQTAFVVHNHWIGYRVKF